MGKLRRTAWAAVLAALGGCTSGPLLDNPAVVRPDPAVVVDNPVWVPQGPAGYGAVFEQVLDVVDDYFEISYSNRYDGRIETYPAIAPGFERFWLPGSPDCPGRTLATLQTIRHRASVQIEPANDGGYFVKVVVYKELEDLAQPIRQTAGAASFRSDNGVERQFEVIDPTVLDANWVPLGRDTALEQLILQRVQKCM